MEETKKKYNNKALVGTILFHGVLILCFFIFGLSTPLPLPEEEGVLVTLGYTPQGRGQTQPLSASPPPPQPQPTRSSQATEEVASQDTEETVAIPTSPRDRQETRNEPVREPAPEPQAEPAPREPEPEPEPQVDPRAMFPGRDSQTTTSQSQGDTQQEGTQGREEGSTDGTASVGGGQGNGVQFSLTGRRANSLPLPEYASSSQGKVVVEITVNRSGQVIRATAGARGTTTSDRVLWAAAEAAALKARFDVKNDAAHEQKGTITYNFIRLN